MSKTYNEYACIQIQRVFKKYLFKSITKYNKYNAENIEDPFTLDSIDEMPERLKFSYMDMQEHVYIFNAIEFEYFIRKNGKWNPYTKEKLPYYVVNRLNILIKYNNLKTKQEDDFKWQNPKQAFTEVSLLMEKNGFYNNVLWFDKLTYNMCKGIIKVYRHLSYRIENYKIFFHRGFEFNKKTYVYDFCSEVIRLFENGTEHYVLCCIFIKCLALYLHDFYINLPEWLLDIDMPSYFIDRNDVLFMYIYNMIEVD